MKNLQYFSVMLLLSFTLIGCGGSHKESHTNRIRKVYSFSPESGSTTTVTTHTSQIEEGKSVNAGFKTGGQIRSLAVDEGDFVTKGQAIAWLDDVDYQLQLNQLETQYAQTSAEIKRLEEMHRHNHVSDNDYEKAKAGLEQLRIQLELVKNQLSYTKLVAPVSGHIVERFMEEGEMVGAGTPVFKILDDSGLETVVPLTSAAYAGRDKIVRCVGRSTIIGDVEIPLDIIGFIPDADNNSLFKMRLKVPADYRGKLLPGMSLNVSLIHAADDDSGLTAVPSRAVFERDGATCVWSINPADSTITAVDVTVHGAPDGGLSMVSGLDSGQEIVAAGVHHLVENEKVEVLGPIASLKDKAAL